MARSSRTSRAGPGPTLASVWERKIFAFTRCPAVRHEVVQTYVMQNALGNQLLELPVSRRHGETKVRGRDRRGMRLMRVPSHPSPQVQL